RARRRRRGHHGSRRLLLRRLRGGCRGGTPDPRVGGARRRRGRDVGHGRGRTRGDADASVTRRALLRTGPFRLSSWNEKATMHLDIAMTRRGFLLTAAASAAAVL